MFVLGATMLLLVASEIVATRPQADKILSLPGISTMPAFEMYSGYLEVAAQNALHYWFVECEDPASQNLIIWFNGGPGCSSMEGLFTENGPYLFGEHRELYPNPSSWNKLGHILYLESPVGVGFSYGPEHDEINDDTTAQDAMKAIKVFFHKFSELGQADIFVTGESYAGFYVPILVSLIFKEPEVSHISIRIKGVMIGNPLLNQNKNVESLVYYSYYHGLFGKEKWLELISQCCKCEEEALAGDCKFRDTKSEGCLITFIHIVHSIYTSGLNLYNMYQDCTPPNSIMSIQFHRESTETALLRMIWKKYFGEDKFGLAKLFTTNNNLGLSPPCSNTSTIHWYLNRQDVQDAIHVRSKEWEICSQPINDNFVKEYEDVKDFMLDILQKRDVPVLLYFGDMDLACNHLGGEWWMDDLGIPITFSRRRWYLPKPDGPSQIGGAVKVYNRLTFALVKGAGHMVPTDQPEAALYILKRFLSDEPL